MILGRFDEAKKILEQWQQKGSLNPFQSDVLYRIAFFENDTATMERLPARCRRMICTGCQLQMQFAFLRGDIGKLRSLSDALVNQEVHAGEKENAANELALHAQLESLLGNYGLARQLCQHAPRAGQRSPTELWRCAEAFGEAGDFRAGGSLGGRIGWDGPRRYD